MDEVKTDNSEVIARLTRERDEARRERDELQRRLEKWRRNEAQLATNQQVARLIRQRDEALAEVERLNTECDSLAHQLNRCNERGGQMRRLLVWAEALIRSLSGWPEHHPSEVADWKEDWRKMRDGK